MLKVDRNTELAQAVVVKMAQTKRIYILMIKVSFVTVSFKRNRKQILLFYGVIKTLLKVWENLTTHVPTEFLALSNFHSCCYNSVETRLYSKDFVFKRTSTLANSCLKVYH